MPVMQERQSHVIRGTFIAAALLAAAIALLVSGGPLASTTGTVPAPGLMTQFGVSASSAVAIVNALNSWWAAALSVVLVPLGLGAAALSIRATWSFWVHTFGKAVATTLMKRF